MSSTNESPDIDNVRKKQKGVINNEDELTWEKGKKFLISVVFILLIVFIATLYSTANSRFKTFPSAYRRRISTTCSTDNCSISSQCDL